MICKKEEAKVRSLTSTHNLSAQPKLLAELLQSAVARIPQNHRFCFRILLFSSHSTPSLPHSLPHPHLLYLCFSFAFFFLARPRAAPLQDGYEPFDRVSHLHLLVGSGACAAGLELTPGSQRFNLISKSDIRYVSLLNATVS